MHRSTPTTPAQDRLQTRRAGTREARIASFLSAIVVAAMTLAGGLPGCASRPSDAPTVLALESASYATTFDAAVALVTDEGMPAVLRDRDGGVIESSPNVSGSLVEPWDWPHGDIGAATESTLNFQRRRVRFEFVPTGFRPRELREDAPLLGTLTPGAADASATDAIDLGSYEGPLELRVWVYLERAYTPYLQRSTWTFQGRTFARNPERAADIANAERDDGSTRDTSVWTPIARDPAFEESILTKLRERLAAATR
jgi:hypothetical protein